MAEIDGSLSITVIGLRMIFMRCTGKCCRNGELVVSFRRLCLSGDPRGYVKRKGQPANCHACKCRALVASGVAVHGRGSTIYIDSGKGSSAGWFTETCMRWDNTM